MRFDLLNVLLGTLLVAAMPAFAQFEDELEDVSTNEAEAATSAPVPTKLSLEVTSDDRKKLSEARSSKNEEAMLKAASRILGKDSKNLEALNSLAVFYIETDKPGLAKIILNRAIADHPTVPTLYNNMGVVQLMEDKKRLALASFRKSLELKSNYSAGAANLASIYLEYKDHARAVRPLEEAYDNTKKFLDKGEGQSVEFANNYAVALTGLGEYQKAERVYSNLIEKNSKNTTVLLNYAILLVERLNKPKEGMSVINKVKFVAEDPKILDRVEELEKKASAKE